MNLQQLFVADKFLEIFDRRDTGQRGQRRHPACQLPESDQRREELRRLGGLLATLALDFELGEEIAEANTLLDAQCRLFDPEFRLRDLVLVKLTNRNSQAVELCR